ncbi:hypothetical protein H4R18_000559 [Coemansia javaensis]|uniref:DUF221-domain-containing protein n=1 Tax=Coemansia javaensis TaxID=2761396 RepID=A0A9W8HN65_9FUNG|nr:hypothetical protein H4R18_000559 [Coemansia javaensis]
MWRAAAFQALLLGEPKNPADDYIAHASDLLTQTVFSLSLGGTAFLAFCLLRARWPDVYAPRGRLLFAAPARMGKTFLGWIGMVLEAKDFDIMYSAGLDALLVLRLFKMLGALSATAAAIGLLVVVPLKVALDPAARDRDHRQAAGPGAADARSWYNRITTAAMGSEHALAVHFAFAYVFTALVYFYFARFAYQAVSLRWHYLLRVRNTRPARSVMVTGIPPELAGERQLQAHFERNGLGRVASVEIVPRVGRLGVLVRRRWRLLRAIEDRVTEILGNPCAAPGYDRDRLHALLTSMHGDGARRDEAVRLLIQWARPRYRSARGGRRLARMLDELEAVARRFHHADSVVQHARREWFAAHDGRPERSSSVGFVTFADAAAAHMAAQAFTYAQPFQLRAELAPEPRDVFWDNVTLPRSARLARGAVALLTYMLMLVYWLTMAFLLSALVSLDSLKGYFPWLPDVAEKNRWLKGLFQYTTPTFTLSLMNACVPYILSWLAALSGIQSRSGIQRSVLRRYFIFLVSNVLLIFTVSRAVLTDYEKWIENPALIPKLLATRLPTAAPFFMDYVILFGLGYYPIQLLQIGSIFVAAFRRMVCRTPREFADAMRPNQIDWAFILPQPMLVFVIMATYSSLAPLVFVLAAVYYVIAYVVTKYLVYYVYARQFETAGEFILPVLKMLTGSLWHYYCLIIGLCALKGAIIYVLLLIPLLWANGYLLSDVSRQFYEHGKFVPLDMWTSAGSGGGGSGGGGHSSAQSLSAAANHHHPHPDDSQPTTTEAEMDASRPSHNTSTDYLQPRPHVPPPLGTILDSIDSEYRGAASWAWERLERQAARVWRAAFSRIYVDPQRQPDIFRDLDRCYSIGAQAGTPGHAQPGGGGGILLPSLSETDYRDDGYDDDDDDLEQGTAAEATRPLLPLQRAGGAGTRSAPNVMTPRFSTTFDDNGGTAATTVGGMRAELMLGRDQRESKIAPDAFTDFDQSPISLLDGVLDQGLAVYEHPYLIARLPTLWLPMKKPFSLE